VKCGLREKKKLIGLRIPGTGTSLLQADQDKWRYVMKIRLIILFGSLLIICSCSGPSRVEGPATEITGNIMDENSFGEDLEFLRENRG